MPKRAASPAVATPVSRLLSGVSLDRTFTYRLHLLHKVTDLESQRAYVEETGLSIGDGRCLSAVGAFGPLSVNDLARAANLTKGQASRSAQYLVEQGLVRKDNDAEDGRGVVLALTASGRKSWQKVIDLVERRNREIFGCLDDQDLATLSRLLDRLNAHAADESGAQEE